MAKIQHGGPKLLGSCLGMATMIRIVVADDHQLVREGIKKILALHADMELAAEASDLESLLTELSQQQVDILLLDLSLSGNDELHALRTVRKRYPALPVLVISSHHESQFGLETLRLGAAGYISKSMTVDVIVKAIRKVRAGGRYISESLSELLAQELSAPRQRMPHEQLTNRETEVLRLLASGLALKQIAARLDISISSVNTYRMRILEKMQLNNSAELIRYAVKHNLVA
ncbi:response regulator [Noviherbaspirillum pedocola]|uniref:Response regulator transcription factor n=1 Tax=Noviherbaspirillum pedocola TaxID=2801341 RepID=A0A934SQU8_9BURK|nr:response regulator transcription factor [Noviherbaspirillum pedocola]MBK4733446.1 response regulator transcription factor [Noviherbaspirillum pedocola]